MVRCMSMWPKSWSYRISWFRKQVLVFPGKWFKIRLDQTLQSLAASIWQKQFIAVYGMLLRIKSDQRQDLRLWPPSWSLAQALNVLCQALMLLLGETVQMKKKKFLQNYIVLDFLTRDACALIIIKCYIYIPLTFVVVRCGGSLRLLQSSRTSKNTRGCDPTCLVGHLFVTMTTQVNIHALVTTLCKTVCMKSKPVSDCTIKMQVALLCSSLFHAACHCCWCFALVCLTFWAQPWKSPLHPRASQHCLGRFLPYI